MPLRNHRPDLNGVLTLDKPLHWSSAKACARIRSITGGAKVGHAGTLDPLATGVLVLCLGRATKSITAIQKTPKTYTATIDLTYFTTTDDAEGEPIQPDNMHHRDSGITPLERDHEHPPTTSEITDALGSRFIGDILQRPPDFSAIKVDGQRAYRLARAGQRVRIQPKIVTIHAAELIDHKHPQLTLRIHCSKGTYIRSLARDLGLTLRTGGHLTALRRDAVGQYNASTANDPRDLVNDDVERLLTPPPTECNEG